MTKGLTLIEILVVMFLLAVIFSTTMFYIPRYHNYATFSIEINKLINNLRYAREMSITEQDNHAVRFDYQNNGYQIIRYTEEKEEILLTEFFDDSVKLLNIDSYPEAKFTLFGAVFKTGKVKLESSNYERIINIKPSGFIKSERSISN